MNCSDPRSTCSKKFAALGIALIMLAGTHASASDGEHTDWPDYPEGDLLSNLLRPAPAPRPRVDRVPPKHKQGGSFGEEDHTDWPDYPDANPNDYSSIIKPPDNPIPNDPNAFPIMPLLPGDGPIDILAPGIPLGGAGIGETPAFDTLNPGTVPAPGGAVLILGLAAAAARRRR